MNDDYLWSGRGEPDPEIERLERLLARYRVSTPAAPPARRPARRALAAMGAVAASLAIAVWVADTAPRGATVSNWRLQMDGSGARTLAVGETVETGNRTARLASAGMGEVRLQPNSRLRILSSGPQQERFALNRGTIHAFIWAPPQRFVVDTPSATTIDLGCSYELTVQEDGSGMLSVSSGWVAFQAGAIESFIPAGAMCRTEPRRGPGLPYYADSSGDFRAAVRRWEAAGGPGAIDAVLAASRDRDALTLWHLLVRLPSPDRLRVARRFAELTSGVDAARVARGDRAAIEAAWNALGLGHTDWWRTWKRQW